MAVHRTPSPGPEPGLCGWRRSPLAPPNRGRPRGLSSMQRMSSRSFGVRSTICSLERSMSSSGRVGSSRAAAGPEPRWCGGTRGYRPRRRRRSRCSDCGTGSGDVPPSPPAGRGPPRSRGRQTAPAGAGGPHAGTPGRCPWGSAAAGSSCRPRAGSASAPPAEPNTRGSSPGRRRRPAGRGSRSAAGSIRAGERVLSLDRDLAEGKAYVHPLAPPVLAHAEVPEGTQDHRPHDQPELGRGPSAVQRGRRRWVGPQPR